MPCDEAGAGNEPLNEALVAADGKSFFDAIQKVEIRPSGLCPMLWLGHQQNEASEQYRIIRTRIHRHWSKPKVIVVTSGCAGDGKTVTATNLAAALALKYGQKVLLVDGDLRRPTICGTMGIAATSGLAQILTGDVSLSDAMLQVASLPTLFVLPAGKARRNPAELLDSSQWKDLAGKLRSLFDYVVLDGPPLGAVADFHLLEAVSDGVILVVRPDHTDRSTCSAALAEIDPEKLIGAVLTAVEDWFLAKSPAYGYYRARTLEEDS
jgi:capsular exopolysaccharide synthesis family protein